MASNLEAMATFSSLSLAVLFVGPNLYIVSTSFLLLVVRHLLLVAMHLFLVASCYYLFSCFFNPLDPLDPFHVLSFLLTN